MERRAGARRIFAYGSLAAPEVMEALLGWSPPAVAAVADGWARYALRDRAYPGIVAEAGASTRGILYDGIDDTGIARLDHFEGSFYERRVLQVRVRDAHPVDAEGYVIPEAGRHLLAPRAWDLEAFRREHLEAWVRHCRSLRRPVAEDLELPEPGG